MNRISFFLFFTFVICGFCYGQSTSIRAPQSHLLTTNHRQVFRSNTLSRNPVFKDWPTSSMSPQMRQWEAILDRPAMAISENRQTVSALISQLRTLGLPVVLTVSAKDDSFFDDEPISLPLPALPLRDRLLFALQELNGCLTMCDGLIKIISRDDRYGEGLVMTVTYDVTALGVDYDNLADHFISVVETDSWSENGGLGLISPITVGDRHLVSISQSYATHRKVNSLLNATMRMGGVARLGSSSSVVSSR